MNYTELVVFILYLIGMITVGAFFFIRAQGKGGEKGYFLGDRQMGPYVTALSAGASDMSAWVLMGLPGAIYAFGMGRVWIAIGLAIGYTLSWILVAPRLRQFSVAANDSITVPQYLTNRFLSKSKTMQIICAVIFIIAYTVYAAASIKACGKLFNTVLTINENLAMYIAALIIIAYTFMGGFKAVCWTDFFQGLLMLGALLIAPIFALAFINSSSFIAPSITYSENYWNILSSGQLNWGSWADILSGIGWGLGYFGMPHIIIRFMAIRSQKEVKKSAITGITWTVLILLFAVLAGYLGRMFIGDILLGVDINGNPLRELVFIETVRAIFPAVISGILLSAILAASMSTADSQLLASASAFAADVYKPIFRKEANDQEMFWAGRFVVAIIAFAAVAIASAPGSGTIMGLVENAWGIFGAAFGPVILLSLFWKRFTFIGAVAGIVTGAVVDILWLTLFSDTGLYEIVPGFIAGFIVAVIATLCSKKPGADVEALYDKSVGLKD